MIMVLVLPNDGKSFGNLWIRGPWICSGYLNIKNSETHGDDDWFLTRRCCYFRL